MTVVDFQVMPIGKKHNMKVCSSCGAVLKYGYSEIKFDRREKNNAYIVCIHCDTKNDVEE